MEFWARTMEDLVNPLYIRGEKEDPGHQDFSDSW